MFKCDLLHNNFQDVNPVIWWIFIGDRSFDVRVTRVLRKWYKINAKVTIKSAKVTSFNKFY